MEKERFGAFIAENRRALGMTQKDLAARLHITDKAVSKWERGLSYPDVTLLEPLAASFGLGVTELVACDRGTGGAEREHTPGREQEEQMVQTLLHISGDSLRTERGRGRRWILVLLVLLAAAVAVLAAVWRGSLVTEQGTRTILHKEEADGNRFVYIEQEGHLLKLNCGPDVDFDSIHPDSGGWPAEKLWEMEYTWDRRTLSGTVVRCQATPDIRLGSPMGMVGASTDLAVVGNDALFGYERVMVEYVDCYPNPYGKGYLFTYTFRAGGDGEDWYLHADIPLLTVRDCLGEATPLPDGGFVQADVDGDGQNELLVRTRWPEIPCILYDWVDGAPVETWLDTTPPELAGILPDGARNREIAES